MTLSGMSTFVNPLLLENDPGPMIVVPGSIT